MKILLYLWQFPQHLLGLLLTAATHAEKKETGGIAWMQFDKNRNRFTRLISGGSFGVYIILPYEDLTTIRHERGHSVQSMRFGPLYLIVVGIYSAVFCNLWDILFHKSWSGYDRHYWYYMTRWTEKRADKLGGVDRAAVLRAMQKPQDARYPAA
jgi:uncharacterized membrane protein